MRLDTEQRIVKASPAEACAKPPPRVSDLRLFQTMDELRDDASSQFRGTFIAYLGRSVCKNSVKDGLAA